MDGVTQQTPGSSEGVLCKMTLQNIKQEPKEVQCDTDGGGVAHTGIVKREASGEPVSGYLNASGDPGSHMPRTETGQQLLQKLLRTKNLQLAAQRPSEGIHNEINGHINSKLALLEQKLQGTPRNMEVWESYTLRFCVLYITSLSPSRMHFFNHHCSFTGPSVDNKEASCRQSQAH